MEHVLYGLNSLQCKFAIVSRVDVEYASYLKVVSRIPNNTIFIPEFQNFGSLNDRFSYGQTSTLVNWYTTRLELAKKSIISELGACRAVKSLNLTVLRTDLKFVRRRKDMFVPDVDKATVWNTIDTSSSMDEKT